MDLFEISKRLLCIEILRRRRLQARTADCILYPGQLHLLDTIIRKPGITQQALCSRLGVTAASIAQSTARMEERGLLFRRADEKDRRKNHLEVTDAGREAARMYKACFDEIDTLMMKGLSEAEMKELGSLLDRLLDNLETEDFSYEKFLAGKDGCND